MVPQDPFLVHGFSTKGKIQHQPDQGFAEALTELKRGHDRLEVGGQFEPLYPSFEVFQTLQKWVDERRWRRLSRS